MKRIVTQEDLDLNPDLVEQVIEVGDEIEIPDVADGDPQAEGGPGSQPQGPETGKPNKEEEPNEP